MKNTFRMSDLGLLSYYLGIEVRQNTSGIMLAQSAYAKNILEKAGMEDCNACHVPMEAHLKLSKASTAPPVDANKYRSIVGSLRYLVHTRPDITFAVGYMSRFMEHPFEEHWNAVKHILWYIAGTLDYGCSYRGAQGGCAELTGFSDSDMAGNVDHARAQQVYSSSSAIVLSADSLRSKRWWLFPLARQSTLLPPLLHAKAFGLPGCSVTSLEKDQRQQT
jgi:hypothetical protein